MKLPTIVKSNKDSIEEARDVKDDDQIGAIPGVSVDDPDYAQIKRRLIKIKKRNPDLYKKMINWE